MRVLLVRHGQTDLNVQKRLQGSSDIPLNERGREQARETHNFVIEKGIVPTKVISSPLGRAIETGSTISGIAPEQIEIEPDLIEMGFGIYEQRNMNEENPQFLVECFDKPATYQPPEGGESYDEVLVRAERLIERMRARIAAGEFSKDDIVLMVSHGALVHGIFEYINKTPRSAYWDFDFNNCALAELFLSTEGGADRVEMISEGFEKNW